MTLANDLCSVKYLYGPKIEICIAPLYETKKKRCAGLVNGEARGEHIISGVLPDPTFFAFPIYPTDSR